MQRVKDDDGAVAVVVALLMVVAMLFAAIVVDVGALYSERRQLQNGTDAAALAVARECALAPPSDDPCVADMVMVRELMDANANDGVANVDTVLIDESEPAGAGARSVESPESVFAVTVEGSTEEPDGTNAVRHSFASIVGIDATTVGADATAAWGAPAAGPAMLPITFADCLFDPTFSGTEQVILYKDNDALSSCATNVSLAGGFAWLDSDGGCAALVDTAQPETFGSDPGNDPSAFLAACGDVLEDLKTTPAMLPVFDGTSGSGQQGTYTLTGFAAFQLTGWKFGGGPSSEWNANIAPKIQGDARGVKGYFTEFVTLADYTLGGADHGLSAIKLVQ